MRRVFLLLAVFITMLAMAAPADAGSTKQSPDILENQSGGGEITADNAHLNRTKNGLSIRIQMETPEPGSYNYPDTVPAARQIAPEIFTGWAFIFANPDQCKNATNDAPGPCNGDDFGDPDVGAGAYNIAGHATGSAGYITLAGHIGVGQTQELRAPGGNTPFPLTNPSGAEVHVAVAPHGQLDPSNLPAELNNPVGTPACDCWWVAIFLPPAP